MSAILIDPFGTAISDVDRYLFTDDIREIIGGPLARAAVLPCGDVLFVAAGCVSTQGFRLSGAGPFAGYGVVIGPRGAFGEFKRARFSRASITKIVAFVTLAEATETAADVSKERMSD
jgi:hypothetical protein